MSATVISDSILMAAPDSQTVTTKLIATALEVDFAKCDCCGLIEECTLEYIERIRERYQGKWICGLCAEAVKDEIVRCEERLISAEEALSRHFNFCNKFRSSGPPPDPTAHLISAMRQLLRKSLVSPRSLRSMPCSPTKSVERKNILARSESCIPNLSLVEPTEFQVAEMQDDCEWSKTIGSKS